MEQSCNVGTGKEKTHENSLLLQYWRGAKRALWGDGEEEDSDAAEETESRGPEENSGGLHVSQVWHTVWLQTVYQFDLELCFSRGCSRFFASQVSETPSELHEAARHTGRATMTSGYQHDVVSILVFRPEMRS